MGFLPEEFGWIFVLAILTNFSEIGSIRILLLLLRFKGFSILILWSIDFEPGSALLVTTVELDFMV